MLYCFPLPTYIAAGENSLIFPGKPMEEGHKVRIGGIKFSEELVQVTVACNSAECASFYELLHLIARKNINIPFLCHSLVCRTPESIFCVACSELATVQDILNVSPFANDHVKIIPAIGTLTLFPHRNDFKLLGRMLNFFGHNNFPVHSFSTSISAIALNTDYCLLDTITEKLTDILALPDNHAPFRQSFRVTQIQL